MAETCIQSNALTAERTQKFLSSQMEKDLCTAETAIKSTKNRSTTDQEETITNSQKRLVNPSTKLLILFFYFTKNQAERLASDNASHLVFGVPCKTGDFHR